MLVVLSGTPCGLSSRKTSILDMINSSLSQRWPPTEEYGFAMLEVNKSNTVLRFQNSDGKVLWDEMVLANPNADKVEVEPIPAKDAETLANYEAEEDQELDTGVPCQWADWEDGDCDATCGAAVMMRRQREISQGKDCEDGRQRSWAQDFTKFEAKGG
eukprot:Skav210593  [mRNA]  locus=scaffold3272:335085:340131:+ [translate_table: standard]